MSPTPRLPCPRAARRGWLPLLPLLLLLLPEPARAQAGVPRSLTALRTLAGRADERGATDGPGAVARFNEPHGVAVGGAGTLYVADYRNCTIRRVTPAGEVSTVAGQPCYWRSTDGPLAEAGLLFPFGVAVGPDGRVYVAECGDTVRVVE